MHPCKPRQVAKLVVGAITRNTAILHFEKSKIDPARRVG